MSEPKTMPKFEKYLRTALDHITYTRLTKLTQISRKKLTMIEQTPEIASAKELRAIALILKQKPIDLMTRYDVGVNGVSMPEFRQLLKEHNLEMKIVPTQEKAS
jgi:hypothetical protein